MLEALLDLRKEVISVAKARLVPACTQCVQDGSSYVRWEALSEFLVLADGCQITGGWSGPASIEAFQDASNEPP